MGAVVALNNSDQLGAKVRLEKDPPAKRVVTFVVAAPHYGD